MLYIYSTPPHPFPHPKWKIVEVFKKYYLDKNRVLNNDDPPIGMYAVSKLKSIGPYGYHKNDTNIVSKCQINDSFKDMFMMIELF